MATSSKTPSKKLSLTSAGLVTPATVRSNTSALKEQLREKEQHIEQLLKERDLERAEVAKAANQTDEAEAKLVTVRQEFEAFKRQQEDTTTLKELLEEERKKSEDLQFRLEESEILRSEGSKSSSEVEEDMKALRSKILSLEEDSLTQKNFKEDLEKQLTEERSKVEKMEKQTVSLQDVLKEKRELQDKIRKINKELVLVVEMFIYIYMKKENSTKRALHFMD